MANSYGVGFELAVFCLRWTYELLCTCVVLLLLTFILLLLSPRIFTCIFADAFCHFADKWICWWWWCIFRSFVLYYFANN